MAIRFDIFPEEHQKYYSRRFTKSSKTHGPWMPWSKAFRFESRTIHISEVDSFSQLKTLGITFTNDEQTMLNFLENGVLSKESCNDIAIQALNNHINTQSHSALDHRLQFQVEVDILVPLLESYFNNKGFQLLRLPDLPAATWIKAIEMEDEESIERLKQNQRSQGVSVSAAVMFRALMDKMPEIGEMQAVGNEITEGKSTTHGYWVPRFHVPIGITFKAWAGFWGFLFASRLVRAQSSKQFWRIFDMHFARPGKSSLIRDRSNSHRTQAAKYHGEQSAGAEWRATELWRSISVGIPIGETRIYRKENPITQFAYARVFILEKRAGKRALETQIPSFPVVSPRKEFGAYRRWRKDQISEHFDHLGVTRQSSNAFRRLLDRDQVNVCTYLRVIDLILRFLDCEGLSHPQWAQILETLSKGEFSAAAAEQSFWLLPSQYRPAIHEADGLPVIPVQRKF